jgi:hypothetical protein
MTGGLQDCLILLAKMPKRHDGGLLVFCDSIRVA